MLRLTKFLSTKLNFPWCTLRIGKVGLIFCYITHNPPFICFTLCYFRKRRWRNMYIKKLLNNWQTMFHNAYFSESQCSYSHFWLILSVKQLPAISLLNNHEWKLQRNINKLFDNIFFWKYFPLFDFPRPPLNLPLVLMRMSNYSQL